MSDQNSLDELDDVLDPVDPPARPVPIVEDPQDAMDDAVMDLEEESAEDSAFNPEQIDVDGLGITTPTKNDPILRDVTDEDRIRYLGSLAMLYTTVRELGEFNNAFRNATTPALTGEALEEWKATIGQAIASTSFSDDYLERALQRPGGRWDQAIVTDEGVRHAMGIPKLQKVTDGEKLTGDVALMKFNAMSGTGSTVRVPLPHTGIWLTMRTPTLEAQTELDQRIAQNKVLLGRSTRGLIYSNHQVYITQALVEFALDHVVDANLVDWSPEALKSIIKQNDLQFLAWGAAYSIYRAGFPISQPCTYDITKCMHVAERVVNLNRLARIDNNALTAHQRKRMSLSRERNTPQTLQAYQDEFTTPESVSCELTPTTRAVFRLPSIQEHINAGDRWVSQITESSEQVLGPNVSPRDRNLYINKQARASSLLQYIHYIDKFIIDEDGNQAVIEGRDDIERICVSLSSDQELVNKLVSGVIKYINDTTVGLIAMPNYACPKCGKWHRTNAPSKYLIPIDAVSVFFTLQQLRLLQMGIRSVE